MNKEEQLKTRNLTMTGTGVSHGGTFQKVRITGESTVDSSLTSDRLRVIGQMDVMGNLHSNVVKVLGQLSVKGDCTAESFQVKGTVTIDGLLNAGKVEVLLYGPCEIKEIGGGQIRVKRKLLDSGQDRLMTVDAIEGDDIRLECTRANVVRGRCVDIGIGCEIDLVEYQETFRQMPKAIVKESKRA